MRSLHSGGGDARTPGLFIAVEGIDGAGKTTQVDLLARRLSNRCSLPVFVVHEPGGTALGEALRQLLIHDHNVPLTPHAELLLFAAARAQLVEERIKPFLDEEGIVLCDRFSGSTLAYQGYGRGLDLERIRELNTLATRDLFPDLTILLDVPPDVGLKRKRNQGSTLGSGIQLNLDWGAFDRFEDEAGAFHLRVREGYLKLASGNSTKYSPGSWVVLDGSPPLEQVSDAVWAAVEPLVPTGNKL